MNAQFSLRSLFFVLIATAMLLSLFVIIPSLTGFDIESSRRFLFAGLGGLMDRDRDQIADALFVSGLLVPSIRLRHPSPWTDHARHGADVVIPNSIGPADLLSCDDCLCSVVAVPVCIDTRSIPVGSVPLCGCCRGDLRCGNPRGDMATFPIEALR